MRKPSLSSSSRFFSLVLLASTTCLAFIACKKSGSAQQTVSGPHLKWQYKSKGMALSHPAVAANGTIYVGTNSGGLQALSPDGKQLWRSDIGAAGVPVIAGDGNIYFAMPQGIIFGVSSDGQTVWKPGYGLIGFATPPALGSNGTLYYLNTASDIWAFRPDNTKHLWSLDTFREGFIKPVILPGDVGGNPRGKGAPALDRNGNLYVSRQNFLHSISSSGDIQWTTELTTGELGQLALGNDTTIYVGDDRGVLYAVNSSGNRKWRFDGWVIGSPIIDTEGTIYFANGLGVVALNPDGSVKWIQSGIRPFTAPVLAADGTLYLGVESALVALKPDGSLKWNLHVTGPTSSPSIAPDGTIVFACGYSWLCAVEDEGSPLMPSAWPKQFHDLANTSNSAIGLL